MCPLDVPDGISCPLVQLSIFEYPHAGTESSSALHQSLEQGANLQGGILGLRLTPGLGSLRDKALLEDVLLQDGGINNLCRCSLQPSDKTALC